MLTNFQRLDCCRSLPYVAYNCQLPRSTRASRRRCDTLPRVPAQLRLHLKELPLLTAPTRVASRWLGQVPRTSGGFRCCCSFPFFSFPL